MRHLYGPAELSTMLEKCVPKSQDKFEVRLLSIVLTSIFAGDLIRSALGVLFAASTPLYKVADISRFSRYGIAIFCLTFAALTVWHLFRLVAIPSQLADERPRRLATWGACGATIMWVYLAALSEPLDLDVWWQYAFKAFGSVLIGALYAQSINAQQIRELKDGNKSAIG